MEDLGILLSLSFIGPTQGPMPSQMLWSLTDMVDVVRRIVAPYSHEWSVAGTFEYVALHDKRVLHIQLY